MGRSCGGSHLPSLPSATFALKGAGRTRQDATHWQERITGKNGKKVLAISRFPANQPQNRLSNQVSSGEMLLKQDEKSGFIASVPSIQYSCNVLPKGEVGAGYDRSGCTDLDVK